MANCYKEVKEIKTMSKIQSMIDTFQAINEVRKIKHDQRIQNEQEELKTKTLEKLSKQLAKLEAKKKFKHASTPTEISETFESASDIQEVKPQNETQIYKAKMQTLDNKIVAKTNNRNSNLHLDKGRIDEVIEMLKKTPTKDLVISTKGGKTRVFINSPNPLKISRVKKFLKNHGNYELEVETS